MAKDDRDEMEIVDSILGNVSPPEEMEDALEEAPWPAGTSNPEDRRRDGGLF